MSDNTSFVKTPPMGWNSWDCYGAAVNEETVRANAKFMAEPQAVRLAVHSRGYPVEQSHRTEPRISAVH